MFAAETVIIVGAGASSEAGLPTGSALRDSLAAILDIKYDEEWGQKQISGSLSVAAALKIEASKRNPPSTAINQFLPSAWRIRDALPMAISIDNYLDAHPGDKNIEICGKLAIVQAILEAERRSALFCDSHYGNGTIDYGALGNTWYSAIIQLLTENCTVSDLRKRLSNIHCIIFNYDRCLEHFFYHALQIYYGISAAEAIDTLSNLNVYHPYGTVGPLGWSGETNTVGFGAEVAPEQLLDLARHIKTFSEGTDPSTSEILAIREALQEARTVMFLGFAFHRMNMRLLNSGRPVGQEAKLRRCFGTAKGFSESDRAVVSGDVAELLSIEESAVRIGDFTCSGLFREYWRSLAKSWGSTSKEL